MEMFLRWEFHPLLILAHALPLISKVVTRIIHLNTACRILREPVQEHCNMTCFMLSPEKTKIPGIFPQRLKLRRAACHTGNWRK